MKFNISLNLEGPVFFLLKNKGLFGKDFLNVDIFEQDNALFILSEINSKEKTYSENEERVVKNKVINELLKRKILIVEENFNLFEKIFHVFKNNYDKNLNKEINYFLSKKAIWLKKQKKDKEDFYFVICDKIFTEERLVFFILEKQDMLSIKNNIK